MSEKEDIGWAILELLGHRRLGGYVREATVAGKGFLRIDVPAPGIPAGADGIVPRSAIRHDSDQNWQMTQFVSPDSVYALTPTTEAMARAVAAASHAPPVQRWELPALPAPDGPGDDDVAVEVTAGDEDEGDPPF
jgi:hypothetical protein